MIIIDWIIALIDRIPDILVYVVPGFVFVKIYSFIKFKDECEEQNKTEFVVLKSIAISYIFKSVWDFAYTSFDLENPLYYSVYLVTMLVSSVLLSYIFYVVGSSELVIMVFVTFANCTQGNQLLFYPDIEFWTIKIMLFLMVQIINQAG